VNWTIPVQFTYGTLFVGTLLLVWEVAEWYPGWKVLRKRPVRCMAALGPFLWTWCVSALGFLCVGGLVGQLIGLYVWGAGWIGEAAYVWGLGGPHQALPTSQNLALTPGGVFMTGILIVIVVVRVSRGGATPSKKRGLGSGALMVMSAGVASFVAVPLASAANLSGAWITGVVG